MQDKKTNMRTHRNGVLRGLSGKVLLLTIIFVMLGEVLIFLPSIANFRIQWLKGRLAQAEIAALAAKAAPDELLSGTLKSAILNSAGVLVISLQKDGSRQLVLRSDDDFMVDASFDLRNFMWYEAIRDAFGTIVNDETRVISVVDKPPKTLLKSPWWKSPCALRCSTMASISCCSRCSCPCWWRA
jgi:hypothetical protein